MSTKFLNESKFTGSISKFTELSNDIFINGIRYDKYTKNIKNPIEIANILCDNNEMILKRMVYPLKEGMINPSETECSWVQDIELDNKFYFLVNDAYNNVNKTGGSFGVIEFRQDGKIEIKKYPISREVSGWLSNYDIVFQDNDSVYFKGYEKSDKSIGIGINFFGKYNKKNLTIEKIGAEESSCAIQVLKINENFTISGAFVMHNILYLRTYNYLENKKILEEPINITSTSFSTYYFPKFSKLDKENNTYFAYHRDNDLNSYEEIGLYKFNILKKNIELLKIENGVLDRLSAYNSGGYTLRCEYFKKGNKQYLILGITLGTYKRNTVNLNELSSVKFYLFEIKDENTLVMLDKYNDDNICYTNMLFFEKESLLLLGSYNNFSVVKITENLRFEETYRETGNYLTYGISEDNKFYLQNVDTSVREMTFGQGVKIESYFDKEIYNFYGQNINSNLNIAVTDIMGKYIDCKVKVKLVGNITFNDGSKIKEIQLRDAGYSTIPIIIRGQTKMKANIEIL